MDARKTLPEGYGEAGCLDLGRDKLMAVLLNVIALLATKVPCSFLQAAGACPKGGSV